ncbi:MAG: HEAT repeat-containing PBS [Geobacteraceae bacterium]|nr:MAG: HEAT repeat-containing PBS [Geobacteraceae bacterium]
MEKMQTLSGQLRSPDEEIRRLAVMGLTGYPLAEIKENLYFALGDGSWRVRKEAVNALLTLSSVTADVMEDLVVMLRSPDNAGLRNSAVEALARLGSQAVSVLSRHVDDGDHDVRRFVIDILGEIGAVESVPFLIRALDDPDPNVCAAAAENLGKIGDDRALPFLIQALAKTDIWLRYTVLEALVRIGKPVPLGVVTPLAGENLLKKGVFDCLGAVGNVEAVPLLVEGLKERVKSAREAAAGALVKVRERLPAGVAKREADSRLRELKGSPYVEGILASLDTCDKSLKESLVKLLGIIGDDRATGQMLKGCRDDRLRRCCLLAFKEMGRTCASSLVDAFPFADEEERRFIAYVCGELRIEDCASLLREGMRDVDPVLREVSVVSAGKVGLAALFDEIAALLDDTDRGVREGAIEALFRLADRAGEPVLKTALRLASDECPEKRRNAAILFVSLNEGEKLSFLIKDEDAGVRKTAVLSLAKLKAGKYLGSLVLALADEESDVRSAAAGALGDIGGDDVLEPLLLALKDEDRRVECAALKSLGKLGSERALPAVMAILDKADGPVMIAALEALEGISGDTSCEVAKSALENPDEEVVKAAIEILARHDVTWLGEYRERLLTHPHWDVRSSFIRAMAALWGTRSLPYIQSALETESDEQVKGQLVELMGRMR